MRFRYENEEDFDNPLERRRRRRTRQRREWDRYHLRTVGCKLTLKQYRAFRALCEENGISVYQGIKAMVLYAIDEDEGR